MADPDPMTCDPASRVYDLDPGTVIPDPIYLVTTLLWASSFLESLALKAFGFCRDESRLGASLEQRHPSKCKGKPDVKPDSNNCTIEWSYPERKGSIRLMFMGVGNC